MKMLNNVYLYILILISLPFTVFAQDNSSESVVSKRGTTAADFLTIGVGARAIALGGAFVAIADDPSAIYWNVGGLAKLKKHGVLFNHSEWIADIKFDFLGASFKLNNSSAVGFSVTTLNMGDMKVRTEEKPEGTGQLFDASMMAVSVAYSISLTQNFSIGANVKYIHERIWQMSSSGAAIDLGVHYITPFPNIELGMSITNFGTSMMMGGNNSLVLHDPDPASSGNNDRIPANLKMEEWPIPLNFQVGVAYRALRSEYHSLIFAIDAMHPNNNHESVNVGAEYVFRNIAAIRAGYKSLFLDESEESLTLGAGLKYQVMGNVAFGMDFAYANFGRLDKVYKYSINIEF